MTQVPSRAELHSLLTAQAIITEPNDPYTRGMTPDQHDALCDAVWRLKDEVSALKADALSSMETADLLRELSNRLPNHALITNERLRSLILTETDAITPNMRIPDAGGEPDL